jgi:hypothetical protein
MCLVGTMPAEITRCAAGLNRSWAESDYFLCYVGQQRLPELRFRDLLKKINEFWFNFMVSKMEFTSLLKQREWNPPTKNTWITKDVFSWESSVRSVLWVSECFTERIAPPTFGRVNSILTQLKCRVRQFSHVAVSNQRNLMRLLWLFFWQNYKPRNRVRIYVAELILLSKKNTT